MKLIYEDFLTEFRIFHSEFRNLEKHINKKEQRVIGDWLDENQRFKEIIKNGIWLRKQMSKLGEGKKKLREVENLLKEI